MNFTLFLFLCVVVCGAVAGGYRVWVWRGERAARLVGAGKSARDKPQQPLLVEYARVLFPVFLLVFALRSFLVEPFRIPSASMLPNLHVGDFILVNKYVYGIRLPIVNRKVVEVGEVERGDVVVFRYPLDPKVNYIKRVVGLPGDVVGYRNKVLTINGEEVGREEDGRFDYRDLRLRGSSAQQYRESLGESPHAILLDRRVFGRNMEVTVPAGNYFVMGDNRDRSHDSRVWRFVPERNLVGKAFFIWFSWDGVDGGVAWRRIGMGID